MSDKKYKLTVTWKEPVYVDGTFKRTKYHKIHECTADYPITFSCHQPCMVFAHPYKVEIEVQYRPNTVQNLSSAQVYIA